MLSQPLCRQLQFSEREVESMLRFLQLGDDDEANLAGVRAAIAPVVDAVVDEFCRALLAVDRVRQLLAEPEQLSRRRATMRRYLLELGRGFATADYFEERLRIGFVHEEIGLGPRYYLGAQACLWQCLRRALAPLGPERSEACIASVHKILALDGLLAVEAWHHVSNQRLERALADRDRVEHELRQQTNLDGLTGVLNHRSVMERIEVEFLRARRFHRRFALLVLDVDHFKQVNDALGHDFGDFVLTHLVSVIGTVVRPDDIVGRYGGDEFVLGLPGCHLREAIAIAERLRLKVTQAAFERDRNAAPVTLSIGVAAMGPKMANSAELFQRADQALLAAKRLGRNRTRSVAHDAGAREAVGRRVAAARVRAAPRLTAAAIAAPPDPS